LSDGGFLILGPEKTSSADEAGRKAAWRTTRKAIRNRLPAAERRALHEKLLAAEKVTTELAETLDREYGLRDKYNVAQPWHFLVREREAAEEELYLTRLKNVRRRQLRAGKVLKKIYGKQVESDRALWENGAYLQLVERIFVRLTDEKSGMPTAELTALTKAMAEHRRVSARGPEAAETGAGGELPEQFAETVRQIYGVNIRGE